MGLEWCGSFTRFLVLLPSLPPSLLQAASLHDLWLDVTSGDPEMKPVWPLAPEAQSPVEKMMARFM